MRDGGDGFSPRFDPEGFEAAREQRSVTRAWGEHLRSRQWAFVVTLTTRFEMGADTCLRIFKEGYIRRLAAIAGHPVPYFVVIEGGTADQQGHIHALVAGVEDLPVWRLRWAWKKGFTHVRRYDPSRGAAYYVSKTIGGVTDDYEVSRRMPPRRRDADRNGR
jgi:hypothetical protein